MKHGFWRLLLVAGAVLGLADQALAWGPATHVGLGSSLLSQLAVLPAAVAAILARNRIAYLYGCIAADIVFAKRLSRVKQFCHHWSTAFRLLDSARDERAKAFSYGYLSHLAADTVAHGKYVPRQVVVSGCSVGFGHFYWELRADATEDPAAWRLLKRVLRNDHSDHHLALASHITDTFLSYDLNRLLFDRMNALTVRRGFRRTIDVWNRCSRWYLSPELVAGYRSECLDRILSILSVGQRSALVHEDPNGTSALMQLSVQRRELRRLKRRGLPIRRRVEEASSALAPATGKAVLTARAIPIADVLPEGEPDALALHG
jgi:hypothetical protein